jgi:hypothetical protein
MRTNHRRGFKERATAYVGPGQNGSNGQAYKLFAAKSLLAGIRVAAAANVHDATNGKHGVARSIRGAKKFVRSRIRFRENEAARELRKEAIAG